MKRDWSRLDIVFNNAGVLGEERSPTDVIAINLTGVIQGTMLAMEVCTLTVSRFVAAVTGHAALPLL